MHAPATANTGPTEAEVRALYERYAGVLHHRCRRILGNDELAADAVQETFARVIRNWEGFRGEASPLTWMYRISTNWCLNQVRNRSGHRTKHEHHGDEIARTVFGEDTSVVSGNRRAGPAPDAGLDAARVRRLLDDADDETRRVVIHLFFDDMTQQEVASLVGLSVPTVRKRLRAFERRAARALGALPVAGDAVLVLVTFASAWMSP